MRKPSEKIMLLKFKIIAPSNLIDSQVTEFSFDEVGGTIGRKPDNTFVLLDPERYISGHHAQIACRQGHFYITDISKNGVFLNNAKTPIGNGNSAEIMNGDKLTIGKYELLAHVSEEEKSQPVDNQPWETTPPPQAPQAPFEDPLAGLVTDADNGTPSSSDNYQGSVDPLDLLGGQENNTDEHSLAQSDIAPPDNRPNFDNLFGETEPLEDFAPSQGNTDDILGDIDKISFDDSIENRPPPVNIDEQFAPPKVFIPQDWDALDSSTENNASADSAEPADAKHEIDDVFSELERQAPRPKPQSSAPQAPPPMPQTAQQPVQASPQNAELIDAFLKGCGVDPKEIHFSDQVKLMHKLGRITQVTINGLMQSLQARASLKTGFRVNKTTIAPIENNPMKFSATAEEALTIILSDDRKGYMPAVDAIAEGFQDLQTHQLAMMAGMQATISAIVDQFDPKSLEAMFDNQSGSSFIPGQKKSRNWEHYIDFYNRYAERLLEDDRNIYGEQFAKAYEEQVAKLSRQGK